MDPYRIVVGFDGSEGSRRALTWAAGEARLRNGTLDVVRAWSTNDVGIGTIEENAKIVAKSLEEDAAEVLSEFQEVPVAATSEEGSPARVLLDHADRADMLVVGSRGHGGFTGLLLGSVGQQVSTHAGSPVVVIVRD